MDTRCIRRTRAPFARRTLSAAALALPALAAGGAFAQETPEQIAAARALGTEGVRLADAGDCAHAVDKLQRAEALHHAPTTLERLGECHVALGRVVLGTEELAKVIREPLPPNAPPAFTQAQERARGAAAAAQRRIARLRIHVEHPPDVAPEVRVDDELVLPAMLDVDRPTDPGTHKVTVKGPGMLAAESSVTLKDGDRGATTLKLDPDPNAPPVAVAAPPVTATTEPATATAPPATVAAEPESTPSPAGPSATPPAASHGHGRVPAYVALGVGVVGLGVGTAFGLSALGTKSTLDSACNAGKGCPASSQSDIDSLGSKATLSTVAFAVGVVGLAVGGWLFFTATDGASAAAKAPAVQPFVGVRSAGLTGRF